MGSIGNSKDAALVVGTSGNDLITNSGRGVTIQAGGGNDTIEGSTHGEVFLFSSAHGNDLIKNFGSNDTLKITAGSIQTIKTIGNDALVSVKGASYSGVVALGGAGKFKLKQNGSILTADVVNAIETSRSNTLIGGTEGRDSIVSTGSKVTLNGAEGDDTLTGSDVCGDVFVFNYDGGNDLITNFGANDTLRVNSGTIASVSSGGNNLIVTVKSGSTSGVFTLKGAGNQGYIQSRDNKTLILGGIDTIHNSRADVKLVGSDRADRIENTGENVTIEGKGDNDTIIGSDNAERFRFSAIDGNDVIENFGLNDTIQIVTGSIQSHYADGADYIVDVKSANASGSIKLKGAAQKYNFVQSGTLLKTDGITRIINRTDNTKVVGTDGRDFIINGGDRVTIESKGGNDTVEGSTNGEWFCFSNADGNDVITNFGEEDSILITSGELDSYYRSGEDYVIRVKGDQSEGTLRLLGAGSFNFVPEGSIIRVIHANEKRNYKDNVSFKGTSGADYMINYGQNVTIRSGAGNDTIRGSDAYGELFQFSSADHNNLITNFRKNDTLQCTAGSIQGWRTVGSNVIVTLKGKNYSGTVTLGGAATLDGEIKRSGAYLYVDWINPIINNEDDTLVAGTEGRDSIVNRERERVTLEGKDGNDTLTGADEFGDVFVFASDQGNDVITNFGLNDTLHISSGSIASTVIRGEDYVIRIGSGSITLQDAGKKYKFVRDGNLLKTDGITYLNNAQSNTLVSGTSGADSIKSTGGAYVTLHGGLGNDTLTGSSSGEVFRFRSDGGNDLITNFGTNGTIHIAAGSLSGYTLDGNDMIIGAKGTDYSGTIRLKDYGDNPVKVKVINAPVETINPLNIISNTRNNTLVVGSSGRDSIRNYDAASVTIQSGVGNDTIIGSGNGEMYLFSSADGNNLITNFGLNDTLKITGGTLQTIRADGDDNVITLKGSKHSGTVRLKNTRGYNFIKDGAHLIVDTVRAIENSSSYVSVGGTFGRDSINNSGSNVTLEGGKGNDTIRDSGSYNVFRFGSSDGRDRIIGFDASDTLQITSGSIQSATASGNDAVVRLNNSAIVTLEGAAWTPIKVRNVNGTSTTVKTYNALYNSRSSTLVSGSGKRDSISSFGSYVTIHAGKDNDIIDLDGGSYRVIKFASNEGNDTVRNFSENDTLQLTAGSIASHYYDGNDLIVSVKGSSYSGSLTLENIGRFTPVRVRDTKGNVRVINYDAFNLESNKTVGGTSYSDRIYNCGYYSTINAGGGADTIYNNASYVLIDAGAGNDSIVGGSSRSTINAGSGNDTVDASGSYLMYRYGSGDGYDVIRNFSSTDTLHITNGSIASHYSSGSDYVINIEGSGGSGSITLKDWSSRPSNIVYSTVIDNWDWNTLVNGTSYDDSIKNSGMNVTISVGGGEDTIKPSDYYGEMFLFSSSDGNNVITNFGLNDTLKITGGSIQTIRADGDDNVISLKGSKYSGSIRLKNTSDYKLLQDGAYLMIDTVRAIENSSSRVSVGGTFGRDSITNSYDYVTIDAGKGNDTINLYGNYNVVQFASNEGNDLIRGFALDDTLHITAGSLSTCYGVGSALVVSVKGSNSSGKVTLEGANWTPIKVRKASGTMNTINPVNSISNTVSNTIVSGTGGKDSIYNSGDHVTLEAGGGDDLIDNYDSYASISGGVGNDSIRAFYYSTVKGGEGNDTIYLDSYYNVIQFASNEGNDVIQSFGANDTLQLTAGSIASHYYDGDDYVVSVRGAKYSGSVTFKDIGLTPIHVIGTDKKVSIVNYDVCNLESNTKVSGTSRAERILNEGQHVMLNAGAGNDTICNGGYYTSIDGGAGDDTVYSYGSYTSLSADGGNDSINVASGYYGTIRTGDGNDTVYHGNSYGQYMYIDLGAGNDYIYGDVDNSTLRGGAGNDTINDADGRYNVYLFGSGDGNDLYQKFTTNDTLHIYEGSISSHYADGSNYVLNVTGAGGSGSITLQGWSSLPGNIVYSTVIDNYQSNTLVSGTSYDDSLQNSGMNVTISVGGGADTINPSYYDGEMFLFSSADGDNIITNFGINDTIKITGGTLQTIRADGNDNVISLKGANYSGSIRLKNTSDYKLLQDGSYLILDGINTINNSSSNRTIYGGFGRDSITNSGAGVTIQSGGGNDTITGSSYGEMFLFSSSDGNNVITNFGLNDTIKITGGTLQTIRADGNDNVISLKGANYSGSIRLKNTSDYKMLQDGSYLILDGINTISNSSSYRMIYGGFGRDSIYNSASTVTIDAGRGNDTIYSSGWYNSIDSGAGNDSVLASYRNTVKGEAGNDTIYSYGNYTSISGGAGNDSIYAGHDDTVKGGAGNDTIQLSGNNNVVQFASNEGNDLIQYFGTYDILHITSGSISTCYGVGSALVVSVKGSNSSGKVTLEGANWTPIKVRNASGTMSTINPVNSIYNTVSNTLVSGKSGKDSICNSCDYVTINAGGGDDLIDGYYGSYSSINGGAGNDSIHAFYYSTVKGGEGNDTIYLYSYYNVIQFASNEGNDFIQSFGEDDTLQLTAGSVASHYYDGDDYVVSMRGAKYSGSVKFKDIGLIPIHVQDTKGKVSIVNYDVCNLESNTKVSGTSKAERIFNEGWYSTINAGDGNDTICNGGYDTSIDGGADDDTVYSYGAYASISGGTGNDFIHANYQNTIDAGAGNDTVYSYGSCNSISGGAGNDSISAYYSTVKGGAGNDTVCLSGSGNVVQFASNEGNDLIQYFGTNDTLQLTAGSIASHYADGSNYVLNVMGKSGSGSITLQGWSSLPGNIIYSTIINNSQSNKLVSGTGGRDSIKNFGENVTISGGADDDTITGSDEYGDLFLFSSADGDNVIMNFGAGDMLKMTAGNSLTYSTVGNDVIVTLKGASHTGTVRLKDAASKKFLKDGAYLIVDTVHAFNNSSDERTIYGTFGRDSIKNSGSDVTIDTGKGNDTIYSYGSYNSLSGGAGNDSIYAWYDDTIKDGAGNYTIELSDNYNVVQFASNEGNDLIRGFNQTDTLHITAGSLNTYHAVGNDVVVSVKGSSYSGAVTLQGAKWTPIKVRSASGTMSTINPVNSIYNTVSNTLVSGKSGKDSICNSCDYVTINAGGGDDLIDGYYGSYSSINGGAGNDSISAYHSTVKGGAGNDTIYLYSNYNVVQFASNEGNDVIQGFSMYDTLHIYSGSIASHYASGSNCVLNVTGNGSSGSITLEGWSSLPGNIVYSTAINNSRSNTLVNGTGGRDSIKNSASKVTIQSGGGNDTITGSDSYGEMFLFSSADGNNVITNFGAGDTLKMTAGQTLSYSTVGNDVIVTLKGASHTGTVRLKDSASKKLLKDGAYLIIDAVNTIKNYSSYVSVGGTFGRDSITNSSSYVTIDAGRGNDTINLYGNCNVVRFASDKGNDLIRDFGSNDTLHITAGSIDTYYAVGNDLVVNVKDTKKSSAVTLNGAANTVINVRNSTGTMSTIKGLNMISNSKSDTLITGIAGRDSIKNSGENVTIQALGGDDTIIGSNYGEMFLFSSAHGNNVITNFGINDTIRITGGTLQTIRADGNDHVISLKSASHTGSVRLLDAAGLSLKKSGSYLIVDNVNTINNAAPNKLLVGTSGRDLIQNSGGNVTIQSGAGDDTLRGSDHGELYLFSSADDNNVITNFGTNDTLKMTMGFNLLYATVGNDVIVTLKGTSYTSTVKLKNTGSYDFQKTGSYLIVDAVNTINNVTANRLLAGTSSRDSIKNLGAGVTIQSGGGNDTITGSNSYGDLFLFSSADGNNVITNFDENDTLKMTAGNSLTYSTVGNDVIVTLKGASNAGTVRLKDSASKKFFTDGAHLIVDAVNTINNYSSYVSVGGTFGRDSIYNSASDVTIDTDKGNDTIYSYGSYNSIDGGAGNDSIYAGHDDTVKGGAGNDTIYLAENYNVVQFGTSDGNDLIQSFGTYDTLHIYEGSISSNYRSGSDYIIEVGSSAAITLQGAAYQAIKVKLANGTMTTLNSSSYELPASEAFEEYWFEQIEQTDQSNQAFDEIESILQSDRVEQFDRAVDFDPDPISDQFKPKLELVSNSARSRLKK